MPASPSSARINNRANSAARSELLDTLREDHRRVKKAYQQFKKLDPEEEAEACEALVKQVLDELTVHAAVEEELLYPAARGALADEDLVDEAEVEHESLHWLIEQLRGMSAADEKYAARFTVLCEYVLHHVKEEEKEMFPQLEKARLNWQQLSAAAKERRNELSPPQGQEDAPVTDNAPEDEPGSEEGDSDQTDDEEAARAPKSRTGASRRPTR